MILSSTLTGGSGWHSHIWFFEGIRHCPHHKLAHKLDAYGWRGNLHLWIEVFLCHRHMKVVSGWRGIIQWSTSCLRGPHGTVLGPCTTLYAIWMTCPMSLNSRSAYSQMTAYCTVSYVLNEIMSLTSRTWRTWKCGQSYGEWGSMPRNVTFWPSNQDLAQFMLYLVI